MIDSESRQFSFDFGFPPLPQTRVRSSSQRCDTFFAILPDTDTAEQANALAHHLHGMIGFRGQPRAANLLHMTVCGVGVFAQLPENAMTVISQIAASIRMAAFTLRLDSLLTFRQPQHLVLCGDIGRNEFRMLHIQLALALRRAGFGVKVQRSLNPHMTLLYNGRKEVPKSSLIEPIALAAREFALVRSFHGEGRHEHIDRWPLLGSDECA